MAMKIHSLPKTPTTPLLPFDIIDLIGSHLRNHKYALQACSLTCRLWHYAVRPHIFRAITLRDEEDTYRLRDTIDAEPIVGPWIQELRLSFKDYRGSNWFHNFPVEISPEKLGNLRSVRFIQIGEERRRIPDQSVESLAEALPSLHAFTSVQSVNFVRCALPYEVLKAIACAFSELSDLHIHHSLFKVPNVMFQLPYLYQPHALTSLRIHGNDSQAADGLFYDLLQQDMSPFARSLHSLTTLQFHFGTNSTALMRDLAKLVFPSEPSSLQHLELTFPVTRGHSLLALDSYNRYMVDNLQLELFTQLRTLHLRGLNHPETTFSFIRRLDTPSLERFTFGTTLHYISMLSSDAYAPLDTCLAEDVSNGRLLDFCVYYYDSEEGLDVSSVAERVRALFPEMADTGILKVMKKDDPDNACFHE